MKPYHSFKNDEIMLWDKLEKFTRDDSVGFVHDITEGLTDLHKEADIIYSEPSWLDGYAEFANRGTIKVGNYKAYLRAFNEIIAFGVPVVLIIGKHHLKTLPQPSSLLNVTMNGSNETAYGWGLDIAESKSKSTDQLIKWLSSKFDCVADPCCGYGNTGLIFRENGKRFIMSDISSKLIAYIAKQTI